MRTVHGFTFLNRSQKRRAPLVPTFGLLPAREVVEPYPKALALYDQFVNAQTAMQNASKAEGEAIKQAAGAEQDYYRKLREAAASGADTSKIKNPQADHLEHAEKAQLINRQARAALANIAPRLGAALAEIAPNVIRDAEASLTDALEDIETAQAALDAARTRWLTAWGIRRGFGHLDIFGGDFISTNPGNVDDVTTALEVLKREEAYMRDWFAEQDHAAAWSRQQFGSNQS